MFNKLIFTLFSTVTSSETINGVEKLSSSLGIFGKSLKDVKSDWNGASGVFDKIGTFFTSQQKKDAKLNLDVDIESLHNFRDQLNETNDFTKAFDSTMSNASTTAKDYARNNKITAETIQQFSTAQNVAATSTVGLTLKTIALQVALNVGVIAAVTVAFTLLAKGIDYVIHEEERLIETASTLKAEYDDLKSSIESMNDEFKTASTRIDELNQKDNLTLLEQSELERLKESNVELERQIRIKEQLLAISQLEAEKAAVNAISLKTETSKDAGYVSNMTGEMVGSGPVNKIDFTKEQMVISDDFAAKIEEAKKQQLALGEITAKNQAEYNKLQQSIDAYTVKQDDANKEIADSIQFLSDQKDGLFGLTVEGDRQKASIEDLLVTYDKWTQADLTSKFDSVANAGQFESTINELKELASQGELTADEVSSPKYNDFLAALNKVGISANQAASHINALGQTTGQTILPEITQSTKNVIDEFSEMETSLGSVSSALNEFSEKGMLSASSLSKLSETFGSLSGFDDFINVLSNSSSTMADVESSLSSLVNEYLSTSSVLTNVNDKTLGLVTAQLKAIGVTNAEEVAIAALSRAHGKLAAEKIISSAPNFLNMTYAEIQALLLEHNASEETGKMVYYLAVQKALVADADLSGMTAREIGNLLKLAQAAGIAADTMAQLARKMQLKALVESGSRSPGLESALDELSQEIEIADIPEINVGINVDTSQLPGAVSSVKSAADDMKQAISSAQSDINNLLNMTMTMLKQKYNDQIDDIRDIMEADQESYEAQKDRIERLKDSAKKRYDADKKALEAEAEAREKQYDADKKALEDIADAKEKEREDAKKAAEDELDAFKKQIDSQKEILRLKEEEHDYQRDLADKQKGVSKIESELAALQFDDSATARKRKLELEEELAEQRADLEEYQHDHSIELQEEALDKLLSDFEETQQKKIDSIQAEMDKNKELYDEKQQQLEDEYQRWQERHEVEEEALQASYDREMERYDNKLKRIEDNYNATRKALEREIKSIQETSLKESNIRKEAMDLMQNHAEELKNQLLAWNAEYGDNLSTTVTTAWNAAYAALDRFGDCGMDVRGILDSLASEMDRVERSTDSAADAMDRLVRSIKERNAVEAKSVDKGSGSSNSSKNSGKAPVKKYKIGGYVNRKADDHEIADFFGKLAKNEVPIIAHEKEFVVNEKQQQIVADTLKNSSENSSRNSLSIIADYINSSSLDTDFRNFASSQMSDYIPASVMQNMNPLSNYVRIDSSPTVPNITIKTEILGNADAKVMDEWWGKNKNNIQETITSHVFRTTNRLGVYGTGRNAKHR